MGARLLKTVLVYLFLHVASIAVACEVAHDLLLNVDPANSRLDGRDRITLCPAAGRTLALRLGEQLNVSEITANGVPVEFVRQGDGLRLTVPPNTMALSIAFGGHVTKTGPPMVTPEGSWLPGEYNWFPRISASDSLELTVVTPAGQRAALTGRLLNEVVGKEQVRATFRAYTDGLPTLFIGPYTVQERMHRGLRLRTYFHAKQAGLAAGYLDDAARQIDHFAELIGPYPYEGFAIVSANHPVGLGYPGLTYVSQEILHLPFMRTRSLPHEIVHVWWGNAVQVADESGNWAEGLTTYMTDYGLADASGRERMRRQWLRDYFALPPTEDTALFRFKGKLHARDQIVGYGKSAYLFHMLAQQIGVSAFHQGLKRFYAAHQGRAAGWADLQSAFEAESGKDLTPFFKQWLDRVGAPRLALTSASFDDAGVQLTLSQGGLPYALEVPIIIDTARGPERHTVSLEKAQQTFNLRTTAAPISLRVDPENDLFRRLVPGETAPILRDIALLPAVQTVVVSMPDDAAAVARKLAHGLLEKGEEPVSADGWSAARPALVIGIGTPADIARALGLVAPKATADRGTAFIWAVQGAPSPTVVVAAESAGALEALLRPLPRYGGDSWLLFNGSRLVERGLWPAAAVNGLSAFRRSDNHR